MPTRGLLYAAALMLLALSVAGFALWLRLADAEAIRTAIGARLEESLGEPVELGQVELVLLPVPAASIRDARIGSSRTIQIEVIEVTDEMLEMNERGRWTNGEAHMARAGAYLYRGELAAADAALRAVEHEAQVGRLPEAIWMHDRIRNQRRLLDGDFEAAQAERKELGRRAKRMGLGYGRLFLDMQRWTITLGRDGVEAARGWNFMALFSAGDAVQASYRAGVVSLAAELGHQREAQRMLDQMAARNFEDIPKDIGYVNALAHLASAAACLGDRVRAERLDELLAPYAAHNTPNSMLFYDGSASFALARLAASLDREARAEEHFRSALEMNERLGARPFVARVGYEYARWLAEQRRAARARAEAQRAAKLAAELGMGWLEERAAKLAG